MDMTRFSWKLLVVRGVIGIVFGIVAMVWPISTVVGLVVLFGAWALIDGAGAIAAALRGGGAGMRLAHALLALVSLAVAFFALARPIDTAATLTWLLGIWLVFRGGVEIAATLLGRREGSLLLGLLAAGLSVLAGILFAANPGQAAVALTWVIGLTALLWGVVFLAAGLAMRRQVASIPDDAAAAPSG